MPVETTLIFGAGLTNIMDKAKLSNYEAALHLRQQEMSRAYKPPCTFERRGNRPLDKF